MNDPLAHRKVPPLDQLTAARLRREIMRRSAPILAQFRRTWTEELASWGRTAIPMAFAAGIALAWLLGRIESRIPTSVSSSVEEAMVQAVAGQVHPTAAMNVALGTADANWLVHQLMTR
jgi:hypothetical protein